MNDNKQNTALLTVIAVATLLVAVVGATFAYFTAANANNSTSTIEVSSGKMVLTFADGSSQVQIKDNKYGQANVQPGTTVLVDKTFTVTGLNTATGRREEGGVNDPGIGMPYNVGLAYVNGFTAETVGGEGFVATGNGGLMYTLTATKSGNVTCFLDSTGTEKTTYTHVIPTFTTQDQTGYLHLAHGVFAPNKSTTNLANVIFKLTIVFPDTGANQDVNKTKAFNGHIVVNDAADNLSVRTYGTTTTKAA